MKKAISPYRVGRPPKFTNKEDMITVIDNYFSFCQENKEPITIGGMAVALGMTRHGLLNYGKHEEFFTTVRDAKQICQAYSEAKLYREKGNVAGIIFAMKNNHGFVDKLEVDVGVKGTLSEALEGINSRRGSGDE